MKLLNEYDDIFEAEALADKLKQSGVLAFVSSKNTHSLGPPSGAMTVGLWVVLNEQYDDAVTLLANPDHEVSHPLSMDEMDAILKKVDASLTRSIRNYLYPLVIVSAAAILMLFIYLHNLWGDGVGR